MARSVNCEHMHSTLSCYDRQWRPPLTIIAILKLTYFLPLPLPGYSVLWVASAVVDNHNGKGKDNTVNSKTDDQRRCCVSRPVGCDDCGLRRLRIAGLIWFFCICNMLRCNSSHQQLGVLRSKVDLLVLVPSACLVLFHQSCLALVLCAAREVSHRENFGKFKRLSCLITRPLAGNFYPDRSSLVALLVSRRLEGDRVG